MQKNFTRTLGLTLAAAALVAGSAAYAQTQIPDRAERAERGAEQTREAVQQRAMARFARMDVNSDGQINEADREARGEARFDRVDTNSDGMIDRTEFAAQRDQRKEMRDERMAAREARGARGGREGRRGNRRGRRGGRGGNGRDMVAQADTDSNGAVSQDEFLNVALARFDAADANNDGTVSREERQTRRRATRQERREARQARRSSTG